MRGIVGPLAAAVVVLAGGAVQAAPLALGLTAPPEDPADPPFKTAPDEAAVGAWVQTRLQLPACRIHASRAQIQQVLINLLLNAIEALAGVSGRPRRIVLESASAGPALVELRVRDNGPGIAPADRERIFDALYSTKPHGTGVGLSISRAIVEAHGGRIECTAAEPHGALFRVVLPVRSAAALKPSTESRNHA